MKHQKQKSSGKNDKRKSKTQEMVGVIRITNEDVAFDVLSKALRGALPNDVQIKFEGWPLFKLSIYGDDFHGTVPTRIMPPILELQSEIHRVYLRAKYGDDNLRRLSDEERYALELVVEVNDGCTEFIAEIGKVFNEAIKNSNMTGEETALTLISIAVVIAGTYSWKLWLSHQEKLHDKKSTVQVSQEETKRLEIVTAALNKSKDASAAFEGISDFKTHLTKKLKPNDVIKVDGEDVISGSYAEEITKPPKQESETLRISGQFTITTITFPTSFGDAYKLYVRRVDDDMNLVVEASHENITDRQIEVISKAGFGVKVVDLEINAQKRDNVISKAKLYKISLGKNSTSD
ncbi:hypothetical protein [uncultured Methylophaga sp.]|uniref:hypothetical protein n=1 Tax=uncultured Methylophaga sp. TaxID=285271 RepID=UPI0030D7674F|tara:strand:- start:901 stop:1944 length:1044 start_codon:yes stop_codon:yes gene_type:complete